MPLVQVSGPDPYAACPPGSSRNGAEYPDSAVEPQIAIDPATIGTDHVHLVGVWQQDRWNDGGAQGIAGAVSFDGGATWHEIALPFSRCAANGAAFTRASDPWVAIGPDGVVYASAVAVSASPDVGGADAAGVLVAVSHDGGLTWSAARLLPESTSGGDGARIVTDPRRPGTAYAVWPSFNLSTSGTVIVLNQTTDGGDHWSAPRIVRPIWLGKNTGIGANLLVDPRTGALYLDTVTVRDKPPKRTCHVVKDKHHPRGRRRCRTTRYPWYDTKITRGVTTSTDGGISWRRPVTGVREIQPHVIPETVRAAGLTDTAIDPRSGRLYMVWVDGRFGHGLQGLAVSSSGDGGRTWTRPVAAAAPSGELAFDPSIRVNSSGDVGVTYDTIPLGASPAASAAVWFTVSMDQGAHFTPAEELAGPFSIATAPRAGSYAFVGDYQGLTAGDAFYPFFVTTASGHAAVYSAAIRVSSASATP